MMRLIGVPPASPPRVEGTVTLPDGRRLGFAEFGDPHGPLVLWFHGSPGARRQVPPAGRHAADELGLRVVCVERPGVGASIDHAYRDLRDWAVDVSVVADRLGHERFLVVGLSGGGPYALACAHELPDRVAAVGLMGSLVPTAGDESAAGGLVALSRPFNRVLTALRRPLGRGLWGFVRATNPLAHPLYRGFARLMPEGDRRVLGDPALEAMFVDDLTLGGRRQFQAMVNDFVLIGRPWGFRLADVRVPVRWWHGDSDPFVPLEQAQRTAAVLPDCELVVRAGESHLGDFAAADEVLTTLARIWEARREP
ncbi:MAG: alpha/beta hydrolase [Actinobacteria bacterium]|nr:MAG: alpha/beta hydrolase [Actinomycetota bacterium]